MATHFKTVGRMVVRVESGVADDIDVQACKDLLRSILERALLDLNSESPLTKKSAESWFDSKHILPNSLLKICQLLNIDPSPLQNKASRDKIAKYYIQHRKNKDE